MFRHIWNNRKTLGLNANAHTRVASVRPCVRVSPEDGFQVRETVVECVQYLKVTAAELPSYGLKMPAGMPAETDVVLEGGSTLVLDEYGDLKFEISNPLPSRRSSAKARHRWQERLEFLFKRGYMTLGVNRSSLLASFHRERTLEADDTVQDSVTRDRIDSEAWT